VMLSNFLVLPSIINDRIDHYTTLFHMGEHTIARIQEWGAGMWYNAIVPLKISRFPHRTMKYGVISTARLLDDLSTWSSVYIAGRLHKPVQYLMRNEEIERMIEENKRLALMVTLSLLPKVFREVDMYLKLASLSYIGDPRMLIGENPKKVVNLVSPIVPVYRDLYKNTILRFGAMTRLKLLTDHEQDGVHTVYTQDVSRSTRWAVALQFPHTLRRLLMIRSRARVSKKLPPSKAAIRTALASIVTKSSLPQSAKGALTVGLAKGTQYLLAKMMKRFGGFGFRFMRTTAN